MIKTQVVIAGGGLAGLTCAKSLVDQGYAVQVFEGEPFLGGRASTFKDADGDWIEQGLHLFLGTYSSFKQLLTEVGQIPEEVLVWMDQVRIEDPEGPTAIYGTNPLWSPVKTTASLIGQNRFLGPIDKFSLLPLSIPALRSMKSLQELYDDQTIVEWWRKNYGTSDVLERVIRPFCRAIQFTEAEDFSAYNFLGWIHHVLYDLPHSLAGSYRGARDELIFQPLARYLQTHGASVTTGVKLQKITYDSETQKIKSFVLESGEQVEADAFVAAMPVWSLTPLIPDPLKEISFFKNLENLAIAPAISVQLWFDRRVIDHSEFVLVARSVVPVYQDQCEFPYPYAGGSRISATISPADEYLQYTDQELVRITIEILGTIHPEFHQAQVVKFVILRHKQHLLRPLPGVMSARPGQTTPVSNLFLAGDWTQQDYFGSQEGAVRGGRACAEQICRQLPINESI